MLEAITFIFELINTPISLFGDSLGWFMSFFVKLILWMAVAFFALLTIEKVVLGIIDYILFPAIRVYLNLVSFIKGDIKWKR